MPRLPRPINLALTGMESGTMVMFALACLRFHTLTGPFHLMWSLEGAMAGAAMGLLVAWTSRKHPSVLRAPALVPALETAKRMVALYGRDAAAKAILEADDTMDQGNVIDFKQWLKTVDYIRELQRDTMPLAA